MLGIVSQVPSLSEVFVLNQLNAQVENVKKRRESYAHKNVNSKTCGQEARGERESPGGDNM